MSKIDSFFVTGGPVGRNSLSYVERQADEDLYQTLSARTFCYVLTPRQMGKTSLVVRAGARLKSEGVRTANVDLTIIGQAVTTEQWYRSILRIVGEQLDIEAEVLEFWRANPDEGPLNRLMRALQNVVLTKFSEPIVIFIDEVDYVRSLPFSTAEFFSAIRALHNKRVSNEELYRLTFCLLGVASLSDLIEDSQITPYNIGREIEVTDFTENEAIPLLTGLRQSNETAVAILSRVLYWTGGHPYLTQRLCQEVAEDPAVTGVGDVDRISREMFLSNNSRISDRNLVFVRDSILDRKSDRASLLDLYGRVHRQTSLISALGYNFSNRVARVYWFLRGYPQVRDDETNPLVTALRLSGVTKVVGDKLAVRNRIYYSVFDRKWIDVNMPGEEQRRQRAAFIRGAVRIGAVATVILLIVSFLAAAALKGKRDADIARLEVERQKSIAENRRVEAENQRAIAERQAWQADEARDMAIVAQDQEKLARERAEELTLEAQKQRLIAVNAKKQTDVALKEAQLRVKTITEYQDGVDQYFRDDQTRAVGHFTKAIKLYEDQLNLDRSAKQIRSEKQIRADKAGKAITLTNTAAAYRRAYDYSEAEKLYKEAQEIYKNDLKDRQGEAYTYLNLGQLYLRSGDSRKTEAFSALRTAERIYKESGNNKGAAEALTAMAASYVDQSPYNPQLKFSDVEQAINTYGQALELFRAAGDPARENLTLDEILKWFDRVKEAKNEIPQDRHRFYLSEKAKALNRRGYVSGEAQTLIQLINSSNEAGKEAEALGYLGNLLHVYRINNEVAKNQLSEYPSLIGLTAALTDNQRAEVIKFLNERLNECRQKKNRSEEAGVLSTLGQVYFRAGDKRNALHYYDETVKISASADSTNAIYVADLFRLIGQHYYVSGDKPKAFDLYGKALKTYQAQKKIAGEISSLQFIGELYYSQGTVSGQRKAIDTFNEVVKLVLETQEQFRRMAQPDLFYAARAISDIYRELGAEDERNQFLRDLRRRVIEQKPSGRAVGFQDPLIEFGVLSLYLGDKNRFLESVTEAFVKPGAAQFNEIGMIMPTIVAAGGKAEAFRIIDSVISNNDTQVQDLAEINVITFGMSFFADDVRTKDVLDKLYARYKAVTQKRALAPKEFTALGHVLNIFGDRKRASEVYLSNSPEVRVDPEP